MELKYENCCKVAEVEIAFNRTLWNWNWIAGSFWTWKKTLLIEPYGIEIKLPRHPQLSFHILLIEPYGIEIEHYDFDEILAIILLIEPYGIEIGVDRNLKHLTRLLIEPYGIEIER